MNWSKAEKATDWLFVALVAYAVLKSVVVAAWRPFWYDELCTRIVVGQPSVSKVWDALRRGADANPPPYYLVERFFGRFTSNGPIALRLPSILAFVGLLASIFVFVRRRSGGAVAVLCAATLTLTVLFSTYATEARPYSIVVACVAFGLVCYQRAGSARWAVLMGLALATAQAMHYYAVLAVMPFGIAEAALLARTRQVRAGVWLALMCSLVPLVAFWPFLRQIRVLYGQHIWSRPRLYSTTGTYEWLFQASYGPGVAILSVVLLTAATVLVILATPRLRAGWARDPFFHEHMLVLGLLAIPFEGYALAKIGHGGLVYRYVVVTALCVPLLPAYLAPRLGRAGTLLLAVLVLPFIAVHESRFWGFYRRGAADPALFEERVAGSGVENPAVFAERLIASAGHEGLPVVISDGLDYLPTAYYASGEWAKRLVCIVDAHAAVAYAGTDSVDVQLRILGTMSPLQIYEFSGFAAEHREFLLYSGGDVPWDWWPEKFKRDGHSLQRLARDGNRTVYLVSLRQASAAGSGEPFR